MYIIKRNGEQNEFNIEKITNAVEAANLSVSEEKQLTYHQIMSIAEKVQKKTHDWIFAIFCILCLPVFGFHAGSVFMCLLGIVSLPLTLPMPKGRGFLVAAERYRLTSSFLIGRTPS